MDRRYWPRLLYIATLALPCAVATSVWVGGRTREPTYEGKPLSYWLSQLPPYEGTLNPVSGCWSWSPAIPRPTSKDAEEAIRELGPNALPILFAKLTHRDSPIQDRLKEYLSQSAFKHGLACDLPLPSYTQRGQAVYAFECLCPLPDPAVAKLTSLSKNHRDAWVAAAAECILEENRAAMELREAAKWLPANAKASWLPHNKP